MLIFLPFKTKKKGYFVGIQEIAGNIYSTKSALNAEGFYNVTTMAILNYVDEDKSYDYPISIPRWMDKFPNMRKYYVFFQVTFYMPQFLYKNDCFIFFWNRSFFPMNLDLILLKFLKKKIAIFHCGDDVRYRPIHNILMKKEGVKDVYPKLKEAFPNLSFVQKIFYQKFPHFLNIPVYTLMQIETFLDRGAYHFRFYQKDFLAPHHKTNNDIPIIVHAPSNRDIKGTQIVLEAIEMLRNQNIKFNFLLLENKVNTEVLKILKVADIVIDYPGTWVGRLAVEGMAHSCIVFGAFNPQYEKCYWDLPILPFTKNPAELAEGIRRILLDQKKKSQYKEKSFHAYQTYYNSGQFVKSLNAALSGNAAKELFPHSDYKEKLLDAAENLFQRLMIRIFVK
ncbi:MAG: hypothetical protein Q8K36_00175 [Alphaproteobacteria bacterium]|nr:hypothetical protein [Alphaproteobacteria bacterium]